MQFLAKHILPNTCVNIMDQYHPCGLAHKYPEINRRISDKEFEDALRIGREEGISRLAD